MNVEPFYTASGKWYRAGTKVYPSAGTLCITLTKENYDYVGIQSLERAILEGEGAHRVACDYSLHILGHDVKVHLPPMPAGYPGEEIQWDAAMSLALTQVRALFLEYSVEPVAIEEPAICKMYGFGGQPDIKVYMTWHGKKILAVWDYKRVAALMLSHYLKIHCYRMLDGFTDCTAGFIAWLQKDGPGKLIPVPSDHNAKAAICGLAVAVNYQIHRRIIVP